MKRITVTMLCLLGLFFCFSGSGFTVELEIDRMTKEELQSKRVDTNVVVVDTRSGRDWKSSEFKIKGAVRPGNDIVQWAKSYDKDTVFVLYCA